MAVRRIPIIQCITHLPPGGAQRVALTLAEGLDRNRFAVHVISGPKGDWVARAKAIPDCAHHTCKSLTRELNPLSDARVVFELAALIRNIQKREGARAIVHTHAPKAGVAGRLAARLAGAQPIHTLHGLPFNKYQKYPKRLAYSAFESVGYLAGGPLVSVTQTNIEWALTHKFVKPENAHLIRPSVNMDALAPRSGPRRLLTRYGIGETDRVLGVVASLKPPKDLFTLLDAVAASRKQVGDFYTVFAGEGEQRDLLSARAATLGFSERVIFAGWMDPIEPLYPELDALVLPSFSEGLPLVLVEARACGVPVIASNVGGVSEIIEDKKTGLLVPPGDTPALAAALVRLFSDAALGRRLAKNGLLGLETYHPKRMLAEHEALYLEMVARMGLGLK